MNKYFNMNEIPVGSKVKVKDKNLTGNITEIFHYPTTFKVVFEDDSFGVYKTHEIELINDSEQEEDNNE